MEHKSRLGAIAAVCAVAAFFTFANCMVGELDEISPDYGAYENMENDVPKAEAEVNTEVPFNSDMLYAQAETAADITEETEAVITEEETESITEAPESEPIIPSEISSAETEAELPETELETEAADVEIITEAMADDNAVTEREYESPLEESAPEGEDAVRVKPYADKANVEIITAVTTSVPET